MWKDIVKIEFDEFGRDFDEQGLDGEGKPIPKKDKLQQALDVDAETTKSMVLHLSLAMMESRELESALKGKHPELAANILRTFEKMAELYDDLGEDWEEYYDNMRGDL